MMRVTRSDVAKAAGVSLTTVSDVLNNTSNARISEETKERVRSAADRLGYRANAIARGLVMQRSFNIGVVICRSKRCPLFASSSYAMSVMQGIQDAIEDHKQNMMLSLAERMSDIDYLGLLYERRIDGLIVLQASISDVAIMEADAELDRYPVVLVSSHTIRQKLPCVCVDNKMGIFQAIEHLAGLGHKRIAYVNDSLSISDFVERLDAYYEAMKRYGLDCDPDIVIEELPEVDGVPRQRTSGIACPRRDIAFEEKILNAKNRPTAILTANDGTALWAIQLIREFGMSVPADYAVVGFDDIAESTQYRPYLTTVRQPMRTLGVIAAEEILDLISGDAVSVPARKSVPTELIIRESSGIRLPEGL